jgi:hypothetical protein
MYSKTNKKFAKIHIYDQIKQIISKPEGLLYGPVLGNAAQEACEQSVARADGAVHGHGEVGFELREE